MILIDGGHETGGLVEISFFRGDAAWISYDDDRDGRTYCLISNRKSDKIDL